MLRSAFFLIPLFLGQLLSNPKLTEAVGRPEMFVADYRQANIVRAVANASGDFNGPDVTFESLPLQGLTTPMSVQFDQRTRMIYWTDISNDAIYRAKIDGSMQETLVSEDLTTPEGLAIDIDHNRMYWTDAGRDKIESANLDGSNRTVLADTGSDQPRGIAVSRLHGFVFWTDWGAEPKIERANIDGTNRVAIVTRNITWPNGITLNVDESLVFWCDAYEDKVESVTLDGGNRNPHVTTAVNVDIHPFDVAIYLVRGDIYITDFRYQLIIALNKEISEFHLIGSSRFTSPTGIFINQNRSSTVNGCSNTSETGEPCHNGVCTTDHSGADICHCLPGFANTSTCATEIDECASSPCQNGGTCIDLINAFMCQCPTSHADLYCQTEIDECANTNPCQHGGTCTDGVYDYQCVCPEGFHGKNCEQITDNCYSSPCVHGSCSNGVGEYTCVCDTGYQGTDCDSEIDECASNPCFANGSCRDEIGSWRCECLSGYYGMRCEVDFSGCQGNPCSSNAACAPVVRGGFLCHCSPGYSGDRCEQDLSGCLSNPCNSSFACTPVMGGDYLCHCSPGYSGDRCEEEIDECASNPCQNGGTCGDLQNAYTCDCIDGFSGESCETDIDECLSSPCIHGMCRNDVNGYTCTCFSGYTGTRCQVRTTCARPLDIPHGTEVVGSTYTYFYAEAMIITCTGSTISTAWLCLGNNEWKENELVCSAPSKTSEAVLGTFTAIFGLSALILTVVLIFCWRQSRSFSFQRSTKYQNGTGNTVSMSDGKVRIHNGAVENPNYDVASPAEEESRNAPSQQPSPDYPDNDTRVSVDANFVNTKDDIPLYLPEGDD